METDGGSEIDGKSAGWALVVLQQLMFLYGELKDMGEEFPLGVLCTMKQDQPHRGGTCINRKVFRCQG